LESIGYMQVQLRLYKDGELFDTSAINAYKECYCASTKLTEIEHQVVEDEAKVYEYVHQVWIKLLGSDTKFVLHIPIHQSDEWEVIKLGENFTLGFYCTLGELSNAESTTN